tara:strand:+ start:112 stop:915 length:804 start_codon:yes stop_codon:yes gene_type:complete
MINIYWIRHGLSCSNIGSVYSLYEKNKNKNNLPYKIYKNNYIYIDKYPKDSKITNFGKKQIIGIADQLKKKNIKFNKILTSSLIRSIMTADEFSKYLNINNIHIVPYIQEIGTTSDNILSRNIDELKKYLNNNAIYSNTYFFYNKKLFLENSNLDEFIKILPDIISDSNYQNSTYNLLIITHGGFMKKFITNNKVANLEIWKQKININYPKKNQNNSIIYTLNKPKKFINGIGNRNIDNYYFDINNLGMNQKIYKKTIKECNIYSLV